MRSLNPGFVKAAVTGVLTAGFCLLPLTAVMSADDHAGHHHHHHAHPVKFSVESAGNGDWSNPKTWKPARLPKDGDRVLVRPGHQVRYDVHSTAKIRLLQVAGTLVFARDRNTELNVGILKVQNSTVCTEDGFSCDLHTVNDAGEPHAAPEGPRPVLEIGTPDRPIPPQFTARIRLHFFKGFNKDDAPAVVCCAGRMDIHGAPLSRTWLDLGADAAAGENTVRLSALVTGWRAGDEVIVTGSEHHNSHGGQYREQPELLHTEVRRIVEIDGETLVLDRPLEHSHQGSGAFRSEVASLSRNVVIESADPAGERGHTLYHRFSDGGISYARFAHLGKENVLGRYPIHFHLLGSTGRGTSVVGAAIVDSHNRWVTVHGTNHMLVRDCVGFRSVGHGFFLEDGTEVWNVFDRNLGVQAFEGKRLPKQVLPFDPNDGAAFWWSNGRNTFVRNTSCENDTYGFRYDSQKRSNFDSRLVVLMPDGSEKTTDIRTLPILRFRDNEAHTEGLYGMVVAGTDRAAPDTRHPHRLGNLNIWEVHYALRLEVPSMLVDGVRIDRAVYGIYRPEFENHVYRNLHLSRVSSEPFNRGLDDRSLQHGPLSVDGLTFEDCGYGGIPLIQLSADNPTGTAVTHIRGLKVIPTSGRERTWINLGGGPRKQPATPQGVPVYVHDYFGPGRHARVVSSRAKDLLSDGNDYRELPPLTGDESRVAEVAAIEFPELLDTVDDLPPAATITWPRAGIPAQLQGSTLTVRGTATDDTDVRQVLVNGVPARNVDYGFHVWEATLTDVKPGRLSITAVSIDAAGNREQTAHTVHVEVAPAPRAAVAN